MNERIRELALQASIPWPDQFDTKDGSNQLTKFAELIVRECARISNAVDDTWTGQGLASAQAFMRHFGVEE
jgi:hypothetical protein